jgi:hypothetical protein
MEMGGCRLLSELMAGPWRSATAGIAARIPPGSRHLSDKVGALPVVNVVKIPEELAVRLGEVARLGQVDALLPDGPQQATGTHVHLRIADLPAGRGVAISPAVVGGSGRVLHPVPGFHISLRD